MSSGLIWFMAGLWAVVALQQSYERNWSGVLVSAGIVITNIGFAIGIK